MQQTKKLQTYMSANNAGQQQIELVKASQCLSELGPSISRWTDGRTFSLAVDHFTVDADFTGIDIVEKDLQFVFKARHDIQTQAQDVLDNGLNHLVGHTILLSASPSIPTCRCLTVESSTDRHCITSVLQFGHTEWSRSIDRRAALEEFSESSGRLFRFETIVEESRS